jgi:ribulose-5-phosphate 4-epimerase/fuculose-1-phosphate aldolase
MDVAANDSVTAPDASLVTELDLLAKASRILEIHGHGDRIYGHVAMRDPQGRGFWFKRHSISLGEVFDHRDFLLIDFDGKVLYGDGKRHSEWPIHAEILKRRPDLNFTAHTHPFYGTIFSAMEKPLPLLHARRAGEPARFEEISDFILTPAQGAAVADALGNRLTLFLRHHGVVYCGRDRLELLTSGIGLEEACHESLLATASSLPWSVPAPDERPKRGGAAALARDEDLWKYYCRVLERAERAGDIRLSLAPVR